jgi:transposase
MKYGIIDITRLLRVVLKMKYIQGQDKSQITLFPDCIEDYVGEDNPIRVIDAFVDSLDLTELGLSFLAYNLKRAINMVGIKELIAAMQ